jgi:hypothetical protein
VDIDLPLGKHGARMSKLIGLDELGEVVGRRVEVKNTAAKGLRI